MTRQELLIQLRSLSSGTIASAIGCDKYSIIDRSATSAILYAAKEATEEEIDPIIDLDGILSFLVQHKNYNPSWCG